MVVIYAVCGRKEVLSRIYELFGRQMSNCAAVGKYEVCGSAQCDLQSTLCHSLHLQKSTFDAHCTVHGSLDIFPISVNSFHCDLQKSTWRGLLK